MCDTNFQKLHDRREGATKDAKDAKIGIKSFFPPFASFVVTLFLKDGMRVESGRKADRIVGATVRGFRGRTATPRAG